MSTLIKTRDTSQGKVYLYEYEGRYSVCNNVLEEATSNITTRNKTRAERIFLALSGELPANNKKEGDFCLMLGLSKQGQRLYVGHRGVTTNRLNARRFSTTKEAKNYAAVHSHEHAAVVNVIGDLYVVL